MIVIFWSVISGNILPIWTAFFYYYHYFKTHSRNFRRLALSYLFGRLCLGRRLIRSFKLTLPFGQSPGHLIFWRLFCSNSLHLGQKLYSNAPPIFFSQNAESACCVACYILTKLQNVDLVDLFSEPFACDSGQFTWSTSIFKNIRLFFRGKTCHYRFKFPHTGSNTLTPASQG